MMISTFIHKFVSVGYRVGYNYFGCALARCVGITGLLVNKGIVYIHLYIYILFIPVMGSIYTNISIRKACPLHSTLNGL